VAEFSDKMSRNDIKAFQWKRLKSMIEYVYNNSPHYRKLLEGKNLKPEDFKTLEDFAKKFPFTKKYELMESQKNNPPFGDFLAAPREKIKTVFVSPGPIFEPHTEKDEETMANICAYIFSFTGVKPGDIAQITFSYHLVPAGWFLHEGLKKAGCIVIPAGVGASKDQLDIMRRCKVKIFGGTPSFLGRIKDVAKEVGVDTKKDLSLRIGIFGAEPLPPSLRKELHEAFGVEAFDFYGVAEVGVVCSECEKHQGWHIAENYYLVEILDPVTGEILGPGEQGEIVISQLEREAMPLIRYGTGDASMLNEETCECGRTLARLMGWLGRTDISLKVKGIFIHPKQVETVIARHPEIGRFQIIVERPQRFDVMTVKAEYKPTVTDVEGLKAKLAADLRDTLRIDIAVDLVKEGTIPPDAKLVEDRRILKTYD